MDQHPVLGYTHLARAMTRVLDSGWTVPIAEITARLEDGTLFEWLLAVDHEDAVLDLGVYQDRAEDQRRILDLFEGLAHGRLAEEVGARHNGYALLLAWCIEGAQQMVRSRT